MHSLNKDHRRVVFSPSTLTVVGIVGLGEGVVAPGQRSRRRFLKAENVEQMRDLYRQLVADGWVPGVPAK